MEHLNLPDLVILPAKHLQLSYGMNKGFRHVAAEMITNPRPKFPNDRALRIIESNPCNPDNPREFTIDIRTSADVMRFPIGAKVKTQLNNYL